MKIAAVVVTYNRIELLKESIQSLRSQTHNFDEIIVINNSSTDGTLNWLQTQTDLTVITQENLGSGGGQHTGIKYAYENGYDWIWCMDDDLVVYPNCLQTLVEFLKKNNLKIGTLQPLKLSDPNGIIHHGADFIELNTLKIIDVYETVQIKGFYLTNAICFEGVLINRNVVKKIGLPRRDFFITNDDREFSLRIRAKLPDFDVVLLGNILMKRLITPTSANKIITKLKNVSNWDVFLMVSYFKNYFLAVKLNFPDNFRVTRALIFLLDHKKWILKILLSVIFFHNNRLKILKDIYSGIVTEGILN